MCARIHKLSFLIVCHSMHVDIGLQVHSDSHSSSAGVGLQYWLSAVARYRMAPYNVGIISKKAQRS